jgi:hypothetical protein
MIEISSSRTEKNLADGGQALARQTLYNITFPLVIRRRAQA